MYETFDVPTRGGSLRVGRWGSGEQVVVAIHGVTGTHADFEALADQFEDEVTLVAPDLRGRGGSNGIAGPFGMAAHADDMARLIETVSSGPATLVGHSMGGFVSVVTAKRHPELVRNLVLVDGGLPLSLGPLGDQPVEQVVQALLGPSLERLRTTFPSVDAYLEFWRPHPALADDWNSYVERRVVYDLTGEAPNLRSSVREEAVVEDTRSDLFGGEVEEAVLALEHPTLFLRVPRGQFNQVPPLYPEEVVEEWSAKVPTLRSAFVPDLNHFTILLTERGARAVADAVRAELASLQ